MGYSELRLCTRLSVDDFVNLLSSGESPVDYEGGRDTKLDDVSVFPSRVSFGGMFPGNVFHFRNLEIEGSVRGYERLVERARWFPVGVLTTSTRTSGFIMLDADGEAVECTSDIGEKYKALTRYLVGENVPFYVLGRPDSGEGDVPIAFHEKGKVLVDYDLINDVWMMFPNLTGEPL